MGQTQVPESNELQRAAALARASRPAPGPMPAIVTITPWPNSSCSLPDPAPATGVTHSATPSIARSSRISSGDVLDAMEQAFWPRPGLSWPNG